MSERRLIFGEVADLYESARPSYPAALVDDLCAQAGLDGERAVLEVGAGTGKATRLFAARGIPVVAVEPSAEMAAVARRRSPAGAAVTHEQADFETWDPGGRRFPLLFAAQSWHWVQPDPGLAKAAAVLDPHGLLAAFWNRADWGQVPMRAELAAAFSQTAPALDPASDPWHPGHDTRGDGQDWVAEVQRTPGLTGAEVRWYPWTATYTARAYCALLETNSAIRLLDADSRDALIEQVAAIISARAGTFELPMRTLLCQARRVAHEAD